MDRTAGYLPRIRLEARSQEQQGLRLSLHCREREWVLLLLMLPEGPLGGLAAFDQLSCVPAWPLVTGLCCHLCGGTGRLGSDLHGTPNHRHSGKS